MRAAAVWALYRVVVVRSLPPVVTAEHLVDRYETYEDAVEAARYEIDQTVIRELP